MSVNFWITHLIRKSFPIHWLPYQKNWRNGKKPRIIIIHPIRIILFTHACPVILSGQNPNLLLTRHYLHIKFHFAMNANWNLAKSSCIRIFQSVTRKPDNYSYGSISASWIPPFTHKIPFKSFSFIQQTDSSQPLIWLPLTKPKNARWIQKKWKPSFNTISADFSTIRFSLQNNFPLYPSRFLFRIYFPS